MKLNNYIHTHTHTHRQEGDGGELVLLPFLGEKPHVIPPLMDRMVIFRYVCVCVCVCLSLVSPRAHQFTYSHTHTHTHTHSSDAMLHRVLPTFRERFCLTVWLDGTEGVNSEEDLQVCVCVCVCM